MKPTAIFTGRPPSPAGKELGLYAAGGAARRVFSAVLEPGHHLHTFHRPRVLLTHPPQNLKDLASLFQHAPPGLAGVFLQQ